ncbi:hypothetical protein EYB33_15145 [Lysinibacillus sphaericus]|uniref:ABC-three component system middle component 1 n=1 Tax=Lysinibacillus sphaericus TaxID=1421 RepID=UPI001E37D7A9|nr:ABC-three component system middle component 1 [Lysinibacillus sphaericus]UDK97560.1 hypothetical protein EYB33_15145 [Lysinibacillus sphaericus]
MVNQLIQYLEQENDFMKITEIQFNYLNYVFTSPQSILGIAVYENEEELELNWDKAAQEFAVDIQSQLVGELYDLKWDMYLVLAVNCEIQNIEFCKEIENDRMYFKKVILAPNLDEIFNKLPIKLEISTSKSSTLFSDVHFLKELKSIVSEKAAKKLNEAIYTNKTLEEANEIIFVQPCEDEEEQL